MNPHDSLRRTRRGFLKTSLAGAAVMATVPRELELFAQTAGQPAGAGQRGAQPALAFEDHFDLDRATLERLLKAALGRGGDFADIYLEYRRFLSLSMEENLLKQSNETIALGAGIRVISGEQTGYGYSSDLSFASLEKAAKTAAAIASGQARTAAVEVTPRRLPSRYVVETAASGVAMQAKIERIQAADRAARRYDPRVKEVNLFWGDELRFLSIINSEGELSQDVQPMLQFGVQVVAEGKDANRQQGFHNRSARMGIEFISVEGAEGIAREAARQAIVLLDAVDAPAGEMPVVLAAGPSGVLLHESVGHPLEADFNRKKASVFSGKVGEKVASELCTVIDDATVPGMRGSLNMDGEGTIPQKATVLIENGILRGYLQDRLSAGLMKMERTGNGRRQDYTRIPIPRMTNTFLAGGQADPQEILRSISRGVYCKTFTGGEVDPAAGKFTFSLHEAYLIEDGKLTAPIKGATLIGSGLEILANVVMVGNDLSLDRGGWTCGKDGQAAPVGVGTPTVKIAKMTVGGRQVRRG